MVCYAEPVVNYYGVLCLASGCESWFAMLSQWLWNMVCYAEPVVMYYVCYTEPVVVNHGVLFWASGCET
jgi:hypothetical protein